MAEKVLYRLVGRYTNGKRVVGYALEILQNKGMTPIGRIISVDGTTMAFLVGRNEVVNCKGTLSNYKYVLNVVGINILSLPIKQVNKEGVPKNDMPFDICEEFKKSLIDYAKKNKCYFSDRSTDTHKLFILGNSKNMTVGETVIDGDVHSTSELEKFDSVCIVRLRIAEYGKSTLRVVASEWDNVAYKSPNEASFVGDCKVSFTKYNERKKR